MLSYFSQQCKLTLLLSESGSADERRYSFAPFLARAVQFPFVTEPGGVEGYLYIHVQTVVKSNVIKIDLLTLSLAHGLVSVKAAGQ